MWPLTLTEFLSACDRFERVTGSIPTIDQLIRFVELGR
jgi:hypothetical protein